LRTEITEQETVDEWIANLEEGATVSMVAEIKDEIAGYASLHLEQAR